MFTMEFNYQEEYSKSSCEETEHNDDTGTGRYYECVFCKRGFTTAQALGGHMNIHRKDRANNKTKHTFPPSSSSKVDDNNYADHLRFYSAIPSHLAAGRNYYSTDSNEVDIANNYHQVYFPAPTCGIKSSHVEYSEVLCVENQRDHHLFGQDLGQRNLSLYANQLCVPEIKDMFEDNNEEGGLDLELRLGHYP